MLSKNYLILILFFCLNKIASAQSIYQIKDLITHEPIPFAKIIPDHEAPSLADIDGIFVLKSKENNKIIIRCSGYLDTLIQVNDSLAKDIFLDPILHQVSEVQVKPGINPAERIMNLVIENRKKNSPTENLSFQYESYSKFFLGIDPDFTDTISSNSQDTIDLKIKNLTDSINLFQIESTSIRKFMPPVKNKEIITAYKVSGFNNPMFSAFFNQLQSFSFYENSFEILGAVYINPIAFGGLNRYLFILEDTTLNVTDTTFTISFRPRKGKNFDGMSGKLYINTNGYAIEKVIAQPYRADSTIQLKIIQEYKFLENSNWFPAKLSTEFVFINGPLKSGKSNPNFVGKGNTYLNNIVLNPPLTRKDFDQIDIETTSDAGEKSDQDWNTKRNSPLNQREKNTYHVIDSLAKAENFDKYLRAFKILSTGKIPLGKFNLDLKKLYTYNQFEGNRLGIGIETSDKIMKRITLGAYAGYGFHDKVFKYGGFTDFNILPKKNLFLKLNYSYDAFERGGVAYLVRENRFDPYEQLRNFFIKNMDYSQKVEAVLRAYLVPRIQFQLFGNYQRITMASAYQFTPISPDIFSPDKKFDLAEIGLEFSWQFREKIMQLGYNRQSMGSKFPILQAKIIKGIKGIEASNYDYLRINVSVSHIIALMGYGKISWQLTASKTIGNVPLYLLQTQASTAANKLTVSVPNSFETILPSTFYSDQQLNLFFRYSFSQIKTWTKKCTPQFSLYHGAGIGSINHKEQHNVTFQSMDKTYYEAGVIIDKLYVANFTGIGIGIFNHYGYYADPKFEKNLVFKLSISLAF